MVRASTINNNQSNINIFILYKQNIIYIYMYTHMINQVNLSSSDKTFCTLTSVIFNDI